MKLIKEHKGLIISFILAVITLVIIHNYISTVEQDEGDEDEYVEIVTLARDVAVGTRLSKEDLEYKEIPGDILHDGAVTSIDEAVGTLARQDLVEGEHLLRSKIHGEGDTSDLSYHLPSGKRAVTISVNEVSGTGGFIQAGDRVDVLTTADVEQSSGEDETESMTKIVLQNLEVLAVGEKTGEQSQERVQLEETLTLAVSPWEAEVLTIADERGRIRLALRPVDEDDEVEAPGVTIEDIFGQ